MNSGICVTVSILVFISIKILRQTYLWIVQSYTYIWMERDINFGNLSPVEYSTENFQNKQNIQIFV